MTPSFRMSVFLILIFAASRPLAGGEDDVRPVFLDRDLAEISPRYSLGDAPVCSPDGRTAAVVITDGGRWAVMINNVRGRWFDGIGEVAFAPDHKTVYYVAQKGTSECLVRDHLVLETELPDGTPVTFDRIERFVIRRDSRAAACAAIRGETAYVVIDRVAYPLGKGHSVTDLWFDDVTNAAVCETEGPESLSHIFINGKEDPQFREFGSGYSVSLFLTVKGDVIYVARGEGDDQGVLVINGKRREYDGIKAVNGTPDAVTFCARKEGAVCRCRIDLGTLELAESPVMELPEGAVDWACDPDGANFAYVAFEDGLQHLTLKGVAFNGRDQGFDLVQLETLRFNAKANRYAYAALDGNDTCVVVNNEKSGPWDMVSNIIIGDGGTVAFQALKGETWTVVVNGEKGPDFDGIKQLEIAPDGKTVHYVGTRDDKYFTVIGTRPTTSEGLDDSRLPVYSSDGATWAHRARMGEKWFVVSRIAGNEGEGRRGAEFLSVGIPVISVDGRNIAYVAHSADGDRLIVNEKPAVRLDEVCHGPVMSRDGTSVAVAGILGNRLLWRVFDATNPTK